MPTICLFSKPINQIFPVNGGVPLNTINNVVINNNYPYLIGLNNKQLTVLQNSGNNTVNGRTTNLFVTAGQLPSGLSLQQLMFGYITVVDSEITEGHELGSAVLGRGARILLDKLFGWHQPYLNLDSSFSMENMIIKWTIPLVSLGFTGQPHQFLTLPSLERLVKYENAKGYATIDTLPHVDQHTTDGLEIMTHFTVYLTP